MSSTPVSPIVSPIDVIRAFPGAKQTTVLPPPSRVVASLGCEPALPTIALVGAFDRPYRRMLERNDIWPHVIVVKRGEPIPVHCIHVIVTDDRALNMLAGSNLGFDDLELWTIEGDIITDGHHYLFAASKNTGAWAWNRWWRFVTTDDIGGTTMLPINCARCEAKHQPRYLWARDARGVGWCRGCLDTRTVPEPEVGASADDDDLAQTFQPGRDPETLDDEVRKKARARRLKLARARAANNRRKQLEITPTMKEGMDQ